MPENFPNIVQEIDIKVQELHGVPNKMNPEKPIPSYFIIKIPNVGNKEKILNLVTYKGPPIRLSADFSTETQQARRNQQEIFQVMKSKKAQPELLYPAKLSFRIERQIKSFPDKKMLKEFIITKPVLQER